MSRVRWLSDKRKSSRVVFSFCVGQRSGAFIADAVFVIVGFLLICVCCCRPFVSHALVELLQADNHLPIDLMLHLQGIERLCNSLGCQRRLGRFQFCRLRLAILRKSPKPGALTMAPRLRHPMVRRCHNPAAGCCIDLPPVWCRPFLLPQRFGLGLCPCPWRSHAANSTALGWKPIRALLVSCQAPRCSQAMFPGSCQSWQMWTMRLPWDFLVRLPFA